MGYIGQLSYQLSTRHTASSEFVMKPEKNQLNVIRPSQAGSGHETRSPGRIFNLGAVTANKLWEQIYMWQSRLEIEGYSVVYFEHITAFEAQYCLTSIKGMAHTRFVDLLDIHASTKHVRSPTLNRSSAIRHFKCSNAIEIRNRITFDFYTGLPHIHSLWMGS